jgi:hypothetical protein
MYTYYDCDYSHDRDSVSRDSADDYMDRSQFYGRDDIRPGRTPLFAASGR